MLMRVHKLFIVVCIAFCAVLALAQARDYYLEGGTAPMMTGLLSIIVGVGLAVYLARFSRQHGEDRER